MAQNGASTSGGSRRPVRPSALWVVGRDFGNFVFVCARACVGGFFAPAFSPTPRIPMWSATLNFIQRAAINFQSMTQFLVTVSDDLPGEIDENIRRAAQAATDGFPPPEIVAHTPEECPLVETILSTQPPSQSGIDFEVNIDSVPSKTLDGPFLQATGTHERGWNWKAVYPGRGRASAPATKRPPVTKRSGGFELMCPMCKKINMVTETKPAFNAPFESRMRVRLPLCKPCVALSAKFTEEEQCLACGCIGGKFVIMLRVDVGTACYVCPTCCAQPWHKALMTSGFPLVIMDHNNRDAMTASMDKIVPKIMAGSQKRACSSAVSSSSSSSSSASCVAIVAPGAAAAAAASPHDSNAFEETEEIAHGKVMRVSTPSIQPVLEVEALEPLFEALPVHECEFCTHAGSVVCVVAACDVRCCDDCLIKQYGDGMSLACLMWRCTKHS